MIFNTSVTDYEGIKKVLSKQEEHDGRFDTVDADHSDIKALIASEVATAKSEIIAALGNVGGDGFIDYSNVKYLRNTTTKKTHTLTGKLRIHAMYFSYSATGSGSIKVDGTTHSFTSESGTNAIVLAYRGSNNSIIDCVLASASNIGKTAYQLATFEVSSSFSITLPATTATMMIVYEELD